MSILDKIKFSFIAATKQVFLFTGPTEKPTEIHTITANIHEAIIGMYLTGPGIITAPDKTEFMLELVMLPALQAAKQRMLNEAQAKIAAGNALVQPEVLEDVSWLADLTDADKEFIKRVTQARKKGQRVSYRYPPFAAEAKFGPVPPKPKKKKGAEPEFFGPGDRVVADGGPLKPGVLAGLDTPIGAGIPPEAYEGKTAPFFNDEVAQQQLPRAFVPATEPLPEQVPVVIVKLAEEGDRNFILERSRWNEFGGEDKPSSRPWVDVCKENFCKHYSLVPEAIKSIDFEQTRTREELDNIPGIL